MTNFEKYKDQIMELINENVTIAVVNGSPVYCGALESCEYCELKGENSCSMELLKWSHQEAKPTLTAREKALCEVVGEGYIARDEDGVLNIFEEEPEKVSEHWSENFSIGVKILAEYFPFITWEDQKPWSIEELLKLEVQE